MRVAGFVHNNGVTAMIEKGERLMKQGSRLLLLLSCAALAGSVGVFASAAAYRPPAPSRRPPARPAVSAADLPRADGEDASLPEDFYRTRIIRLYRGRVAVFEEGQEWPVEVLPTDAAQLPPDALERLAGGVYAVTEEQYRNYLEDFS